MRFIAWNLALSAWLLLSAFALPHSPESAAITGLLAVLIGTFAIASPGLPDIQKVIREMGPEPGARAFLDALRDRYQVIILSDTFYEFAMPLMAQLGMPTLFCHRLEVDPKGFVSGYRLRMKEQKRASVRALKELAFQVIAAGDSYNDTAMLAEAHAGILFRPPQNVIDEFPQFPVVRDYPALAAAIDGAARRIAAGP